MYFSQAARRLMGSARISNAARFDPRTLLYTGGSAGSLLDPILDELPTPAEAARWGSPTAEILGVAIVGTGLVERPRATAPNGKFDEGGLKLVSSSLLLLPAHSESEHEVILNVVSCPADALVSRMSDVELFVKRAGPGVAGAVADQEGVVLLAGGAAGVDEELEGDLKKNAAGDVTGNAEPVLVSVGGRKEAIGNDGSDAGEAAGGVVVRAGGPDIVAGVRRRDVELTHLAALGTKRAGTAAARARTENIHASSRS